MTSRARNIDMETILRAAGIGAPRSMQGRDLESLAQGRTAAWQYVRYIEATLLYDLGQDPREERNLERAGGHDAQLKAMLM